MRRRYRRRKKDDAIEVMGWVALGVFGLACLAKRPAAPPAPRPTYIGIPTPVADFVATAQAQDMWCWAACIQMILNFYGIPITQDEIVTRVYRYPINEPATDDVISASLNAWGINAQGRRFVVRSYVASGPPTASVLTQELINGRPILLAFSSGTSIGHAVVITAASRMGSLVSSVIYRDPSPTPENLAEKGRVELAMDRLAEFLPSVRSHWLVSVQQL
jgi:hypothetical protein